MQWPIKSVVFYATMLLILDAAFFRAHCLGCEVGLVEYCEFEMEDKGFGILLLSSGETQFAFPNIREGSVLKISGLTKTDQNNSSILDRYFPLLI